MENVNIEQKLFEALSMATESEIEEIIKFLGNSVFREVAEIYLVVLIKDPNELLGEIDTGVLVDGVKKSFKNCFRDILVLDYKSFVNKM